MKMFFKLMLSPTFILAAAAALAQACFLYFQIYFYLYSPYIGAAMTLFQGLVRFLVCTAVINREDSTEYKLTWCALIFILPLFFAVLYFLSGRRDKKKRKSGLNRIKQTSSDNLAYGEKNLSAYISSAAGGNIHGAEGFEYYKNGTEFFDAVFNALEKAEKYIFIEFYSFERGFLFAKLINLLREKAAGGVEIKILYDGFGCTGKINRRIIKIIRSDGIEIKAFNPPVKSLAPNVRTHRKIVCADGLAAFTGGANVGDEYINKINPYGHWRDTGIKIGGGAARDFALMFLQLWHAELKKTDIDYYALQSAPLYNRGAFSGEGYIQPFADSPHNKSRVSKNVFLSLIRGAESYLYISTPYLLLDNELLSAVIFKAESGVDVCIMMPHIPDKKAVFVMTRSFYGCLIRAGVKIYEYRPGFNHAKAIIADGHTAYTGSCNLDHRALYFQHECGAVLYGEALIKPLSDDFINTLDSCVRVTTEKADGTLFKRFFRSLLRFFSPLF